MQKKVNNFSTIKERVVKLVEFKRVKKETFFSKIGTTSANFRGNAKNTPLNSSVIENIFTEFPDLSLEWLLTGRGEMLRKNTSNSPDAQPSNTSKNVENQCKDTTNFSNIQENTNLLENLLQEIKSLSKETGRLEAENKHLREQLAEKNIILDDVLRAEAG